ncbi:MAG: hypothetical protein ACXWL2_00930 [Candidatus Chromulinivorax sp.]
MQKIIFLTFVLCFFTSVFSKNDKCQKNHQSKTKLKKHPVCKHEVYQKFNQQGPFLEEADVQNTQKLDSLWRRYPRNLYKRWYPENSLEDFSDDIFGFSQVNKKSYEK